MAQDTRKDPRAKVLTMTVRYKSATVDEFIEHHSHDVSRGGPGHPGGRRSRADHGAARRRARGAPRVERPPTARKLAAGPCTGAAPKGDDGRVGRLIAVVVFVAVLVPGGLLARAWGLAADRRAVATAAVEFAEPGAGAQAELRRQAQHGRRVRRVGLLLGLACVAGRSLDETVASRAVALREIIIELLGKGVDHPACDVLRVLAGLESGTALLSTEARRHERRDERGSQAQQPPR